MWTELVLWKISDATGFAMVKNEFIIIVKSEIKNITNFTSLCCNFQKFVLDFASWFAN